MIVECVPVVCAFYHRTSIGATLMKTMGWKEGQGVGPKTAQKTTNAEEGMSVQC